MSFILYIRKEPFLRLRVSELNAYTAGIRPVFWVQLVGLECDLYWNGAAAVLDGIDYGAGQWIG